MVAILADAVVTHADAILAVVITISDFKNKKMHKKFMHFQVFFFGRQFANSQSNHLNRHLKKHLDYKLCS